MEQFILRDRVERILDDQPFWIVSFDRVQELYCMEYNEELVLCVHTLKFKEWDFCLVRKNAGPLERETEEIEEEQEEQIPQEAPEQEDEMGIPNESVKLEGEVRTYEDAVEQGIMHVEAQEGDERMHSEPIEQEKEIRIPEDVEEQAEKIRRLMELVENQRKSCTSRETVKQEKEVGLSEEAVIQEQKVRTPYIFLEREQKVWIPGTLEKQEKDFNEPKEAMKIPKEDIEAEKEIGLSEEAIIQEQNVRTPYIFLEREQKVWIPGTLEKQEIEANKPEEALKIPKEYIEQEKEVRRPEENIGQEPKVRTPNITLEKEQKVRISGIFQRQQDVNKSKETMRMPKEDIDLEKESFTHAKPWLRCPIQESYTLKKKRGGSLNLKSLSNPKLPPIKLPSSNSWKIHVTKVRDFNNIRFIIMGEDYSGAHAKLITDMIAYYKNEENRLPVKHIRVGGIYVAKDDDIWYRVQVLALRGETVTVFVLDCGEELQLAIHDLYILHKRFWKTPQQVITCSLAGFEFVTPHPPTIEYLDKLIFGKDIFAQVISREENISLFFMDEEKTNINQSVVSYLMKNLQKPAFPEIGDSIQVFVTNITVNGCIYFQIRTKSMDLLQNLLDVVRKQVDKMANLKDISPSLCLAKFSENGSWYRAIPQTKIDTDGQVLVQLVDYGVMEKVSVENLKAFDIRHLVLSNIPSQALVCQLYNIPPNDKKWSKRVYNRLQELMPVGNCYLLKVRDHGNDRMPLVEIYSRKGGRASCKSVNEILYEEELLFSDNEGFDIKKVTPRSTVNPDTSSSESRSDDSVCSSEYESPLSFIEEVPHPKLNVGAFLQVIVIDAASPTDFAIQLIETEEDFKTLASDMNTYYNNATNLKKSYLLDVGDFCAVHDPLKEHWLRGKITKTKSSIVSGLHIDYAHHFFVSATDIQPLHSNFTSLPWQAVRAKICGISPKDLDWTEEDCEKFRERVLMKPFVTNVLDIEHRESEPVVVLKLIDVSSKDHDEYIDNFLVEKGIALRTRKV